MIASYGLHFNMPTTNRTVESFYCSAETTFLLGKFNRQRVAIIGTPDFNALARWAGLSDAGHIESDGMVLMAFLVPQESPVFYVDPVSFVCGIP